MNRFVTYILPCNKMCRSIAQEKSEMMVPTSPKIVRTNSSLQGLRAGLPFTILR